jgi:hypothetical protein
MQSILDISELKTEIYFKIRNNGLKFKDLELTRWDIIQRLNDKSMEEQQINIHNWCKELGNLIEDQFKRTM